MQIRPSTPEDFSAVEALLGRSYPALMAAAYEESVLARALPRMTKANPELLASGTFYLAEEEGEVVGCGGWTFAEPGSGRLVDGLAHLRHFAVDPARARSGIGRLIFDECARIAAERQARRLQAFSGLNAEPFYASMGLKRLDIVHVPMGDGVVLPVVLMERAIGPTA